VGLVSGWQGDDVPLTLKTRAVGDVTIVRCAGRIVAGGETESLREHVTRLLPNQRNIALHLGDVVFIDSSGLGMLVRLLTSTRSARGDLKLCNVPESVYKVLKMTNLITLFDVHDSEEAVVSGFYRKREVPGRSVAGPTILCLDQSADVLAYLRVLLRNVGYNVLTNSRMADALILVRATRPNLLVLGPSLSASPGTMQAFQAACATLQVVELGNEFSTLDAAQAATDLLENIQTRLHPPW
jgi:anti-sigma B factor antagonist